MSDEQVKLSGLAAAIEAIAAFCSVLTKAGSEAAGTLERNSTMRDTYSYKPAWTEQEQRLWVAPPKPEPKQETWRDRPPML